MSFPDSLGRLPIAAVREFEKVCNEDWMGGVPLVELLDRINRLAVNFLPEEDGSDVRRVKRAFTERSFRHYQTLGCIDAPEKRGRLACYGPRHLAQALLVRVLLWERVPAERIAAIMADNSEEETRRMLLGGVEIVARAGVSGEASVEGEDSGTVEGWKRISIAPGVELHLRDDVRGRSVRWREMVTERIKAALRRIKE